MQRFKKILFVCENGNVDADILSRAVSLAVDNKASLNLFHVYRENSIPSNMVEGYEKSMESHLRALLDKALAKENKAPRTSIQIEQGIPFIAIIQNVIMHNYDLVFKPAENTAEPSLPLPSFSSMEMHLLRECPCALWLYRPHKNKWDNLRLMAAVDPDNEDPVRNSLNKAILELATSLRIRKNNARLDIVNCWSAEAENTLRDSPFLKMQDHELEEYVEQSRQAALQAWEKVLAPFDLKDAKIQKHFVKADPSTFIPDFVKNEKIDILVMGTVARTGIKGFIIGNMAETILNRIDCSVLALKPEGFVSPVEL